MMMPRPELVPLATYLRTQLDKNGWKVSDFNEAMGLKRHATAIYPWLNGTALPSAAFAEKLQKLFPNAPPGIFTEVKTSVKAAEVMEENVVPMLRTMRNNNPLQFSVLPDGTARLQLDLVGPVTELSALLRMILDQNELLRK